MTFFPGEKGSKQAQGRTAMILLLQRYMLSLKLLHVGYLLPVLATPFGSSEICVYVF